MSGLISNWPSIQSLPNNYILPPNQRPGNDGIPPCKDIPIIDLGKIDGTRRDEIIQQLVKASQEFGFFQVINHGVSQGLMDQTMAVFQEFFAMPAEYKARFYSTEFDKTCRLYTSSLDYDNEDVHYWRDNFTHRCHPLEDYIHLWPEKPHHYREVVTKYSIEGRNLLLRILDLICEGIGLRMGYFEGEISKNQLISVNHHIPCPDPSLTLGMPAHFDINLITMVHQGSIPGFQAFKDGQWIDVQPLPNAFIIIPGFQLRVISNKMLKSAMHRVVTNLKGSRTTIGTFLTPSDEALIQPAEALVKDSGSILYRGYTYQEFIGAFMGSNRKVESALESFKIQD